MGRDRPRVPGAKRGRARVGGVVSLNRCHRRQMGRSGSAHRGLPYDVPGRRDRAHRDVAADGWRPSATYALATGIAVLLLLLVGAGFVRPPGAPLHPSWGLFQWALLAVWFSCTVVLALRLLRVARA